VSANGGGSSAVARRELHAFFRRLAREARVAGK